MINKLYSTIDVYSEELYFAKNKIKEWKNDWYKIFYVWWVFDMFHSWHEAFLTYLNKKICHKYWNKYKIVIGIDSDKVTKKRKWKNRPYDDEFKRKKNLQKNER